MFVLSLLTFLTPALPPEHTEFTVEMSASSRIEEVYNVIVMPQCNLRNSIWYCGASTSTKQYKVNCSKFKELACEYPTDYRINN